MYSDREKPRYPSYTLRKLNDEGKYTLKIDKDYVYMFDRNYLTNIVWRVTQEFHSHNFWEICLVIKGHSRQKFLDAPPIEMYSGSVCLLRPHDVHCVSPVQTAPSDSPSASEYLHRDIYIPIETMQAICGTLHPDLYDRLNRLPHPLYTTLSHLETNRLESLFNEYADNMKDFSFMSTVVISHILCSLLESKQTEKAKNPDWINTLLDNLNREDFMIKSVKEIIDSTGYNQSYVCRQFKKYTSKTLTDYIHFRKVSYSTSLLINFSIPISVISHRLNFADQSAYTKIFKKYYGVTPGQWRKLLSEQIKNDIQ